METDKLIQTILRTKTDFHYFVSEVFSQSKSLFPDGFISGQYIKDICSFLNQNKRTARIGAREHFKSTAFYAHFMWKILNHYNKDLEAHYFSFKESMGGYHISKIKNAISSNPFFESITDKKPTAESVIRYTWDGVHFITLEPKGMLGFKRGIHSDLIYVDDPFQDPGTKMSINAIEKVNEVFKAQILDMVKDEIHVCGTPQTNYDFFFDKEVMHDFNVRIDPAIVDHNKQITLWPEWMDWEKLMARKRAKGSHIFAQEYLCAPTLSSNSFINRDILMKLVDKTLLNRSEHKKYSTENTVIAGFDIGKKRHPSHAVVFEIKDGKRIMLHQKFLDNWDYKDQVEYIKLLIQNFGIDLFYYDATRGEFDGFGEEGILPDEMVPIHFSLKSKGALSAQLDKAITNNAISFIDDRRLVEQMLLVTNDLQAIETPDGHGDSFWSVAMTFKYEERNEPDILII